ncbi:MAG: hypothetical protein AB2689_05175, partial [Candidatus Thiodiazotropha taylori]
MTIRINILILNLVFIILATACGGGGGGDDTNPSPDKTSNSMSGRIFIGNDGYGSWILDLQTGHYSKIPGVEWEDNDDYHHSAEFSAFPAF